MVYYNGKKVQVQGKHCGSLEGRGQCSGCRPGLTLKKIKKHLLVILEHSKNVGGVRKNSKGHHFEYTGSHIETTTCYYLFTAVVFKL